MREPTPPGTGLMAAAVSRASAATSPTVSSSSSPHAVDADANDGGAGFEHIGAQQTGLADSDHDQVGLAAVGRDIRSM